MRKTWIIGMMVLCAGTSLHAQTNLYPLQRVDSIEVLQFGLPMPFPWAGGLNAPSFSEMDLDFDGVKDLVVFDALSRSVKTFINLGTPNQVSYVHAPEYQDDFPPNLRSWVLLRDYNCDNKEDLFTYRGGGIAIYKNTSTSTTGLSWELYTDFLPAVIFGQPAGVYCSPIDVPAIDDIDGDGDLDIVNFIVGGIQTRLFRNTRSSTECDSMKMERIEGCWGDFYENALNDSIVLFSVCKGGGGNSTNANRHAGSTITTLDMDGDGDKEVLLGDIESTRMVMLHNGGDNLSAQMTSVEYNFPANTVPVNLQEFNAGYHLDVNNDGKKDLLVASSNESYCDDIENVWYYRNDGTSSNVSFTYSRRDFLVKDMVDLGTGNHPYFIDVDQDGLQDLLVGNTGYYQGFDFNLFSPIYNSQLAFFHNVGDSTTPRFELITDDYLNLSQLGLDGIYPTFGDMDDDGDLDMITGDINGQLHYFTNTAGAGNPLVFSLTTSNYMQINNGPNATPTLYDMDGDSLLDLVIGEYNGTLNYHKNEGTATNAFFSPFPVRDSLGDVVAYTAGFSGRVTAAFTNRLDSTGQTLMILGDDFGNVRIYNQVDNNLFGSFQMIDSIYVGGSYVSVNTANINFTDSVEIIFGESTGGMGILGLPAQDTASVTPPPLCMAPSNLSAGQIRPDSALLDWSAGGGSSWNLEWGATGFTQGTGTLVPALNSTNYQLSGLTPDTEYDFYVQDSCMNVNASVWVGPLTFRTDTLADTAVNSVFPRPAIDALSFRIYPNPAGEEATLQLTANLPIELEVEVTNVVGQQQYVQQYTLTPGTNRFQLPMSSWAKGVYIIRAHAQDTYVTERLIKK